MQYVPHCNLPTPAHLETLKDFVLNAKRLLVLTGAGISTESGIPDYRSAEVGLYARSNHRPIQFQEFVKSVKVRQRYWARNFVGWPYFSVVQPNRAHAVLAQWERTNRLLHVITQNVDALHRRAGTQHLLELHGCTHEVVCRTCAHRLAREDLQQLMTSWNLEFGLVAAGALRPDGDVMLSPEQVETFKIPTCPQCHSDNLMPDIIFFGDNLPPDRRDSAAALVDSADRLLCVGTSLQVFSALRLVSRARDRRVPIALVNIGPTRADPLVDLRVEGRAGYVLHEINDLLA